jgi:hypothetical protein
MNGFLLRGTFTDPSLISSFFFFIKSTLVNTKHNKLNYKIDKAESIPLVRERVVGEEWEKRILSV